MPTYPVNSWIPEKRQEVSKGFLYFKAPKLISDISDKNLKEYISLDVFSSTTEDQFKYGSCVANAIVQCIEQGMIQNKEKFFEVSRMFLYYLARKRAGLQDKDQGCYIHDALRVARDIGSCPEEWYPYEESNLYREPSQELYRKTAKIEDYFRIEPNNRIKSIKDSLRLRRPIIFGQRVTRSFMNVGSNGDYIFNPKESPIGYHCMKIEGIDDSSQSAIVKNSWGTRWARNGYVDIPYALIEDESWSSDFYSVGL